MRKLLLILLFAPLTVLAEGGGYRLDTAPIEPNNLVSLQSGARTFVNYCMNCHGAQYLRYNKLTDLGLTESQIKDNLMFTADKIGETMQVALSKKDGKAWFGVAPPDLSLIARSRERGVDWLYTYLRTFYRDPKTVNGWNNAVFPNVAMPHMLWTLQGERALKIETKKDLGGHEKVEYTWSQLSEGTQSVVEYDRTVRDLVNFLAWVSEPTAGLRQRIGIIVLWVLGVLFIFAWLLKRSYWKDVH